MNYFSADGDYVYNAGGVVSWEIYRQKQDEMMQIAVDSSHCDGGRYYNEQK